MGTIPGTPSAVGQIESLQDQYQALMDKYDYWSSDFDSLDQVKTPDGLNTVGDIIKSRKLADGTLQEYLDPAARQSRLGHVATLEGIQGEIGARLEAEQQAAVGARAALEAAIADIQQKIQTVKTLIAIAIANIVRDDNLIAHYSGQSERWKSEIAALRVNRKQMKGPKYAEQRDRISARVDHLQGQITNNRGLIAATGRNQALNKFRRGRYEATSPILDDRLEATRSAFAQTGLLLAPHGSDSIAGRRAMRINDLRSLENQRTEALTLMPQIDPSAGAGGADLEGQLERARERIRVLERTAALGKAEASVFGSNFAGTFHSGGVIGGTGEQVAHVQGGEGIFTRDQMSAMGGGGANVEVHIHGSAGVGALIDAVDVIVDGKLQSPSNQRRLANSVVAGMGYQGARLSPRERVTV